MNYELKLTHTETRMSFLYHNVTIYFTFFLPDFALCIQLRCKPLPKANLEKQYVIWPPVTLYSFAHEFPQDKVIKVRFGFHYQDTRIILCTVFPPLRSLTLLPRGTAISLARLLLRLNKVHQSTFWASTCSGAENELELLKTDTIWKQPIWSLKPRVRILSSLEGDMF